MTGDASNPSTSEPVTVVISRRVRPGHEAKFERLSGEMSDAASVFPGNMGANIFRPSSAADPEYRVIFKFRTAADLERWNLSTERAEYLAQIESLLEVPSKVEAMEGLITWFSLPGQNPVQPPPKYKMTLVSWLALWPTVTLIFWLLGDVLVAIPLVPRIMMVTAVVMVLMSYVLMPRFTRWFAFWLFPKAKRDIR